MKNCGLRPKFVWWQGGEIETVEGARIPGKSGVVPELGDPCVECDHLVFFDDVHDLHEKYLDTDVHLAFRFHLFVVAGEQFVGELFAVAGYVLVRQFGVKNHDKQKDYMDFFLSHFVA